MKVQVQQNACDSLRNWQPARKVEVLSTRGHLPTGALDSFFSTEAPASCASGLRSFPCKRRQGGKGGVHTRREVATIGRHQSKEEGCSRITAWTEGTARQAGCGRTTRLVTSSFLILLNPFFPWCVSSSFPFLGVAWGIWHWKMRMSFGIHGLGLVEAAEWMGENDNSI